MAEFTLEQFNSLLSKFKQPDQEIYIKKDGDKLTEMVFVFKDRSDKLFKDPQSQFRMGPLAPTPVDLTLDGSWQTDGTQQLDGVK